MRSSIPVSTAVEVKSLLDSIEEQGLIINQDFAWHYTPSLNNCTGDYILLGNPSTVDFDFADEKIATYFRLRQAK